ncbi:hypothetical protein [Microbacterium sp.]|uniref:hypothetical protein n=1 Tax=Microbacterium sp. TaxID=51671 RepID=UPI003F714838
MNPDDDPEPVDPVTAWADVTASDPKPEPAPAPGQVDRDESSEPIAADIINWRYLSSGEAGQVWADLRDWVEWFTVRYHVPPSIVPNCWWQHEQLVEELTALYTAHVVSFDDADTGLGPIGWHERLAIAMPRLTRAYGGGCSERHQTTKPRTWSNVTDENLWTAWTTQAHAEPAPPTGAAEERKEG